MSELLFFIIGTMLGGCIGIVIMCLVADQPPARKGRLQMNEPMTFLDFFSGVGGFPQGL